MTQHQNLDQPDLLSLLFPPPPEVGVPCPAGATDVDFTTGSGTVLRCRFFAGPQAAPIVFLYPAPAASGSALDEAAAGYLSQGLNVLYASYRSCTTDDRSPSLANICDDSATLLALATDWLREKGASGPLFVMGQSLGTVCALEGVLHHGEQVKGMILESGILHPAAFLKALGGSPQQVQTLEGAVGTNLDRIDKIKVPTLMFHGARDTIVPVAEAEKLQVASGAKTKQFFVVPGAEHHTVRQTGGLLYLQSVRQFIDTVCGTNTWRHKRRQYKSRQQEENR